MLASLLPPAASTTAQYVDPLLKFLFYVSLFFVVLIFGLTVFFVIRYQRREERGWIKYAPSHNPWLELTWISIPTIIVLILFVWGFRSFLHLSVAPAYAYQVKVTGQKWFWSFDYPEGFTSVNELVVPIGKPVKLLLSSRDVIHSFFVPAFRVKRDVLPNRYTIAWFMPTQEGDYPLFCAEYCGAEHSKMVGKVRVVKSEQFSHWVDSLAAWGEGMSLEELGGRLYTAKACNTCHSLDGSPGNGPSFKGIFGHSVKFTDGSEGIVDENYIRESLLQPSRKVVLGFQPIMPSYQGILKEREIEAIIAFLQTLK